VLSFYFVGRWWKLMRNRLQKNVKPDAAGLGLPVAGFWR